MNNKEGSRNWVENPNISLDRIWKKEKNKRKRKKMMGLNGWIENENGGRGEFATRGHMVPRKGV